MWRATRSRAKVERRTPQDAIDEQIDVFVRAGYMTTEEVVEAVSEMFENAYEAELSAIVRTKIALRRQELDFIAPRSGPGAHDRLRRAFEHLEEHGILARENYWCCTTCAYDAIMEEIAAAEERGEAPRGFVFFHHQDTDRAADTGLLLIRVSGMLEDLRRDGIEASRRIGEELMMVLRAYDFTPEWLEEAVDTVKVPMTWDKRPPHVLHN